MATINPVITHPQKRVVRIEWASLASGDVGLPVDMSHLPDKTVHVVGTFNTATVSLQGSNVGDGIDTATGFVILNDPQGNTLGFSAAGVDAITQLTRWIRPSIGAGGGSTNVNVIVMATI